MIAGQQQPAAVGVPQCEGKNTVEARDAVVAPLLVAVNNYLRIGFGHELVALLFQFLAQLDKVINFSVEHNLQTPIFIPDGLRAPRKIDDAQPAMPQPHWPGTKSSAP